MGRPIYVDCFSGASGDMLLGALLDAGVSLDDLRAGLASLPVTGWSLDAEAVRSHGLPGTRAKVKLTEQDLQIVSSIVSDDLQKRSLDALLGTISAAVADSEAVRIGVRGPLSLFEPLTPPVTPKMRLHPATATAMRTLEGRTALRRIMWLDCSVASPRGPREGFPAAHLGIAPSQSGTPTRSLYRSYS